MRKSKRFIIDVEEEYQENAVFFGEEFLCFEDDSESLVSKLNEQQTTIKQLEEENDDLRFALRTEQAFTRVEKDKKLFLSKEEFLKELEEDE